MELKNVIKANKHVTDYGEWESGDIPLSKFPLKKRKLKQSKEWSWKVIKFNALGHNFLVLIRLNTGKQEFYAHLAHFRGEEIAIICCRDLHVSHKNWHCHFVKGDTLKTSSGYLRDKENTICFPKGNTNCNIEFDIDLNNALLITSKFYRFKAQPTQLRLI